MTHKRLPSDIPKRLRAAGLKVAEVPGWRGRGRPASTGKLDPVGVLAHHTATSRATSDAALVDLLKNGRSDLPGPLCHFGLMRDGTVYVVADGRANHAGRARASGSVAAGDGNALYWGIEAANDGRGEPWPKAQYDAYVRLCAVLCREVTHNSVRTVRGHKETSVTGKVDPTFSMDRFRADVSAEIKRLGKLAKVKKTRGAAVDKTLRFLRKARKQAKVANRRAAKHDKPVREKRTARALKRIKSAIKPLRKINKRSKR